MKSRMQLTLLNWRYWVALPLLSVLFPVLVAWATCYLLSRVFDSAQEAIEYTFSRPVDAIKNFVQRNKYGKVTP